MVASRLSLLTARRSVSLLIAAGALAPAACRPSHDGARPDPVVTASSAVTTGGGVTSTNIQLRVSKNACAANQAQDYFKITNASSGAVPLSSLSIKYWINDTTGATLTPNVWYGGCVTSSNGTCVHPVSGVTGAVAHFSPACGPDSGHQANWEVTISTNDSTSLQPGQSWSNIQTAVNLSTWANFAPGSATWFSRCGTGGAFLADTHFAVYLAGDLVTAEGAAAPLCRAPQVVQIQNYLDTTYYATTDVASSFLSASGQQIDCIDFSAQKSVKAWRARGVTIPTTFPGPLPLPASMPPPNTPAGATINSGVPDQNGHSRRCAAGFVPALRPTVAQVQAAGGVAAFKQALARRPRPQAHTCTPTLCQASGCQDGCVHDCWLNSIGPGNGSDQKEDWEHAAGIQTSGFSPAGAVGYYGLTTTTPVYAPAIQPSGEHTDSQFWAQTGGCDNWFNPSADILSGDETRNQCRTDKNCTNCNDGNCGKCAVQSLEMASITFAPGAPQTAIFFTNDGYFASACWADSGGGGTCPGCPINPDTGEPTNCFVTVPNAPIVPGMTETLNGTIATQYGQAPAEVQFTVWNGSTAGNPGWWIYFGNQLVGIYPPDTFNWPDGSPGPMSQGPATYLQVGGEVFDTWPGGQHTNTSMVSDNNAWSGYQFAAYHRNVGYYGPNCNGSNCDLHDANLTFITEPAAEGDFAAAGLCGFKSGSWLDAAGEPGAYTIATGNGVPAGAAGWNTYFYFGGGVTSKEISGRCPQGGCPDLHFQTFTVQGGGNSVTMGPSVGRACVLLEISGKFKGGGESARITLDADNNWVLTVTSLQDQPTTATAGCFDELSVGNEFSWAQGDPTVTIGPAPGMACYLTSVTGHFQGGGELVLVTVDPADNQWKLGGTSQQEGVAATARCVPASGIAIRTQGQGNQPRDLGPNPDGGQICALSRMTGHFEGGGENIVLSPGPPGGDWTFAIASQQNDIAASATCFMP